MKRRRLGLRGFLMSVCATTAAYAQPSASPKSIGFSNLVFRPAGGDRVGIADEDFRVHILEAMRARGLNAVGAEDLVFGGDRSGGAELMLGGTVTELECVPGSSSAANVTCRMGVEWQVLDVQTDKVVYKLLSRGRVTDVPKEPVVSVGKQLVVANLESLTKHSRFAALLTPEASPAAGKAYPDAVVRACRVPARTMPAASEHVLDATVVVQTASGFGSGFLLGADGFVLTAAHVVPESSATIKLRDGRQFPASVIRVDRRIDIALLRLAAPEGSALPCLPVRIAQISVGADVYAVGTPASRALSFSLARGIVSGIRLLQGLSYLQTDAAVSSGNSGGPLVTANGEAAAVVSFKLVGGSVEGVAFGVPLGPGLRALGISVADKFSSPELSSAKAVPPVAARKLFVDAPDPLPSLPGTSLERDTRVQGMKPRSVAPEVKRVLFGTGVSVLGVGLTALMVSYLADRQGSEHDTARTFRTWGFIGSGLGAGMVTLAFVLP